MFSIRSIKLSSIILVFHLVLCVQIPFFAQAQAPPKIQDPDFYSYMNSENLMAQLDAIAIEIQSEPESMAYFSIYRKPTDLLGTNHRLFNQIKYYLVENRGIDKTRLVFINSGINLERGFYCFVIPPDSEQQPKSVEPDVPENETYKFDSHYYAMPYDPCAYDIGCLEGEYQLMQLDDYAEMLKKQGEAKAYLIGYAEYCPRCGSSFSYSKSGRLLKQIFYSRLDKSNIVLKMLLREKDYLINKHKVDSSRIVLINGGYREWRTVDLWIVSPNGEKPKLTPTTFPSKQKKKRKR